jgi:hypothetical protein
VIDQKILREDMQDLAILGQRDGASGINGAPDVLFFDIPRPGSK